MGLGGPPIVGRKATGRSATGGGRFGSARFTPPPRPVKRGGGRGRGGGGKATASTSRLPDITSMKTTATAPAELTDYSKGFREDVIGGYGAREKELREKGGAFMEESQRQGREGAAARVEEARQRAKEEGVPFDEAAAMESALKEEMGGLAEGRREAEAGIDRNMAAEAAAYTSGLGIVESPSQTALQQRAQSSSEQGQVMQYLLGKYGAETGRMAANQQAKQAWMSMLGNMLNFRVAV